MSFSQFLTSHLLRCPIQEWLHMDCPGCGMQRSFIALLEGHVSESLTLHPATIPLLLIIILLPLHLTFHFRYGAFLLMLLFALVAILSLAFYVYKILHPQLLFHP